MSIFLSRGSSPRLSLAPSPYLGAGGGGDKGFGVGIALIDLEIEDRGEAQPGHVGDEQPRRGLADRREGEGGRNRHHQDEDDEIERGCHLMLAEEERRPGEIGDQLNEEEQQREPAPLDRKSGGTGRSGSGRVERGG